MRAIYNRYFGKSGRVQRMPEPPQRRPQPDRRPRSEKSAAPKSAAPMSAPQPSRQPQRQGAYRPAAQKQPGGALFGGKPGGLLGSLTSRLDLSRLETEDLILLLILYLLYRESGDEELLIMMGAMFLL